MDTLDGEVQFTESGAYGLHDIIEESENQVDGSELKKLETGWYIEIVETNYDLSRKVPVDGKLGIGQLMNNFVENLDIAMDWSDHAMWWPEKNIWLDKTRWTLDQYNITADAIIHFTPMHKTLRVQLPDLRYIDCNVDFSVRTFNASIGLCKDLGIRHPEELSLCKPLAPSHLKENYQETAVRKRAPPPTKDGQTGERIDTNTFISKGGRQYHSNVSLNGTINRSPASRTGTMQFYSNPGTLRNGNSSPFTNGRAPHHFGSPNLNASANLSDSDLNLVHSPTPQPEVKSAQLHPKSLVEKARMNVGWLDSSLSIMEQGVREFDTLCLRFKYYSFYDLNPKYDAVRINMIYEQAKWQLLNEEVDCTEEEMLLFAALQLQVGLQNNVPQPHELYDEDDDVDSALNDLQVSLQGSGINGRGDMRNIPHLGEYLRYFRPKRFTLKSFKRHFFVCRDLMLSAYRNADAAARGSRDEAILSVNLKGCEVTPDVNLSQRKYQVKLEIPSAEGMTEMWLRCDTESQYAKWMAACRMGAKGKSMADSGYDAEVKSIQALLSMQHPASQPAINPSSLDINVEEYVAPRFMRKLKSKLRQRILEAHTNVKDLNLLEAKMNFIKAWQSLPDFGVSLFVVKFHGEKKDELLGVTSNKIMRMTLIQGDHLKTWRFSTMKAWNVNWETKHMMIQFDDEKNVIFNCLSADCKVVHEFIGGYIFLSMRSKDSNQQLNADMFHKLTGGWV